MKPISAQHETAAGADPERWLEEYGDWLYQFAVARVQDSHAAEDLVQETLVSGFRGFHGFQGRSTVRTWLTTILRNRIADYYQKVGQRRRLVERSADREADSDPFAFSVRHASLFHPKISNRDFETSMEREEFWESVRNCLEKLPTHLRQAFIARLTDEEKSLEEISEALALTKNNLAVRLFRSRLLLRECLERSWVQS